MNWTKIVSSDEDAYSVKAANMYVMSLDAVF